MSTFSRPKVLRRSTLADDYKRSKHSRHRKSMRGVVDLLRQLLIFNRRSSPDQDPQLIAAEQQIEGARSQMSNGEACLRPMSLL